MRPHGNTPGVRAARQIERESGVRLRFKGGIADGAAKWFTGKSPTIRAVDFPPIRFDVSLPPGHKTRLRSTLYRIDEQPQPNGDFIAREIGTTGPKPKREKTICHRCGHLKQAACPIPGCPFQ